ncbi:oligoendopeptidase F [Vaginisenegalia massiliensis]|uniref:oligoendopeptidase F n=1 Tax=Vaginisenegalia massiliensis TaxID=2058294 RepID=UPI000F547D80|nr:oligoendopeptidase F [Vaginisenegalia massiliensis]
MTALPLRHELPVEETWDLSLLFADQAAFEQCVAEFKGDVISFKEQFQGQMTQASQIKDAILAYNHITILLDHLLNYGQLAYSVDRTVQINEENENLVGQLGEWYQENTAFFKSELLALDASLLDEARALPELAAYHSFIDDLERQRPTLFDSKTESILGALSRTLFGQENLYNALKFQDLSFDDFQVGDQTYSNSFASFEQDYEVHPDRQVRLAAWEAFHRNLASYQHTAATNYITLVQTHKKMATLRGFDSVFDYLLFDQNVSQESYNQIIDTLMSEWAPVMRRYAKMMEKEHQIDRISLADIKSSFVKQASSKISIPESRKIVQAALAPLGEEYSQIIEDAFNQRWIDYPMNYTKATGGFCASPYQKPAFIMLNWTGLLNEVLVLAHELGHAAHFTLAGLNQPILAYEPSLYFVEAPSTCNEVITCQYLLQQPLEAKAKRALIADFITSTYYHNMVTHLLEAAYQRKVYQAVDRGDLLNANVLNQFFKETLEEFWGDALEINPGAELTWMRQPHYFDGLYSYTYSAGLAIGTQVGQKVAQADQATIQQWLNVLKKGNSLSPLELAKEAGVDLTTPEPLRQVISYISSLLDQIEELA